MLYKIWDLGNKISPWPCDKKENKQRKGEKKSFSLAQLTVMITTFWPWAFYVTKEPLTRWGVLGWVSDRDAQHRLLTRNTKKGQKGGGGMSKLYILPNFDKKRVEIRLFPYLCSNIGVEIAQIASFCWPGHYKLKYAKDYSFVRPTLADFSCNLA